MTAATEMKTNRIFFILIMFIALAATGAHAALPDLPRQELWVKAVSMVVGLFVIFGLSILGLNRILYGPVGMEAEMASRFSVIVGVILSFLWFLYLFGQIFNTTVTIVIVTLGILAGVVFVLRGGDGGSSGSGGSDADMDNYQY